MPGPGAWSFSRAQAAPLQRIGRTSGLCQVWVLLRTVGVIVSPVRPRRSGPLGADPPYRGHPRGHNGWTSVPDSVKVAPCAWRRRRAAWSGVGRRG